MFGDSSTVVLLLFVPHRFSTSVNYLILEKIFRKSKNNLDHSTSFVTKFRTLFLISYTEHLLSVFSQFLFLYLVSQSQFGRFLMYFISFDTYLLYTISLFIVFSVPERKPFLSSITSGPSLTVLRNGVAKLECIFGG